MFFIIVFVGAMEIISAQEKQLLLIHLKSFCLDFFENDSLIFQFSIRTGKSQRPTPLGEGYVYEKREKPVFRYADYGSNQGKIIYFAECENGLKKIDYKIMRSLGLCYERMDSGQGIVKKLHLQENGEKRYSIHSIACDETIGKAMSKGCVGLRTNDMLQLFPRVKNGAKFIIIDN
ncbi:MAG: L,D-transpeptidase [Patescibacteria group bacterium]|nr:L,D-transpeptidase [Patescibacteria group bacterium]